jgi:hypothetical protein
MGWGAVAPRICGRHFLHKGQGNAVKILAPNVGATRWVAPSILFEEFAKPWFYRFG